MSDLRGKIQSTHLGHDGHGYLTAIVVIEGEWGGQGFGAKLYGKIDRKERMGSAPEEATGLRDFIIGCLEVADAKTWEELKGKAVRIKRQGEKIVALGHIKRDAWFIL